MNKHDFRERKPFSPPICEQPRKGPYLAELKICPRNYALRYIFGKFWKFCQISKLRIYCTFKNVKVEAQSKYHNESTRPKGSEPWTFPNVFQEFEKIPEL